MSETLSRRDFLKYAGVLTAASLTGSGKGLDAYSSSAFPASREGKAGGRLPSQRHLQEAKFYRRLEGNRIQCQLCPWYCTVASNERGRCGARENQGGTYYTMVYGKVAAQRIDPIEKDPLHHVRPGLKTFAIATAACNLVCAYCQSWQLSQSRPEDVQSVYLQPEQVVQLAKARGCGGIAYTYTEPVNFIEYATDVAAVARRAGLLNICHTDAYINPEPLDYLCAHMDAINVDLKGFTEKFYQEVCGGHLKPVLEAIKQIKQRGTWLELTYLVLPTLNDKEADVRRMCEWIQTELGPDTPLHFTRFFPQYKLRNLPATPVKTLEAMRKIAFRSGLRYTYIGNVPGHGGESTYCPCCGLRLIWRVSYRVREVILRQGRCPRCREEIPGLWA